jgi:dihydrofolate reductase
VNQVILIAAVADNGVIGSNGTLPFELPDDLARFARMTRDKTIVMGRKTWESLPKRPLPRRRNLVLSRSATELPGAERVASVEQALELAGGELWVIGGEETYRAFLPFATRLELTRVHAEVEGDTVFPPFEAGTFEEVARQEHPADARHASPFSFVTYARRP